MDLTAAPRPETALALFGSYRRGTRYPNTIIGVAVTVGLLSFPLHHYYGSGKAVLLLLGCGVLLVWGLFMRLDPREYLVLTPEGIWCRAWGPERLAFSEFKAVYPHERGLLRGVVLVPRSPAELRTRLSWLGRYMLRSGGGTLAHAGTLTLWTTEVELDQETVLVALRAEVLRARAKNSHGA